MARGGTSLRIEVGVASFAPFAMSYVPSTPSGQTGHARQGRQCRGSALTALRQCRQCTGEGGGRHDSAVIMTVSTVHRECHDSAVIVTVPRQCRHTAHTAGPDW
jgi:hypothetical protein